MIIIVSICPLLQDDLNLTANSVSKLPTLSGYLLPFETNIWFLQPQATLDFLFSHARTLGGFLGLLNYHHPAAIFFRKSDLIAASGSLLSVLSSLPPPGSLSGLIRGGRFPQCRLETQCLNPQIFNE